MDTANTIPPTSPYTAAEIQQFPAAPGYEILALVGRGGMGKVYRARHLTLDRIVALKVLASEPSEKLLARFREEARAVAKLHHPNIAQLFDTGIADGQPFYTQEFLDGGTLAQRFAGKPQPPIAAASVLEIISRAIQHSHENGILHRDLKPGNIMLAGDGTPKVTDFGLAKTVTPSGSPADTPHDAAALTRTGEIVGTPGYMPPEQASGVVAGIGPPADVYALGAMLYEALTGRPPFQSSDPFQTVLMVLTNDPVSPRILQPETPRDLETICLKCLEKSPKRRYASAGELADDLKRFLNREPILARPVNFVERATKWARRKPWQAIAAALGVLFVVGLAIGLFILADKNQQVRDANTDLEESNKQLTAAKTDLENSNTQLTVAKNESEETLALTLVALDRYFFEISAKLKDMPNGEPLRREVLDEARNLLDKLGGLRPAHRRVREYRAEAYYKLSAAEVVMRRLPEAAAATSKARDSYAALAKDYPAVSEFQHNVASTTFRLAVLTRSLGQVPQAERLYADAVQETEKLVAAFPRDPDVLQLAAEIQFGEYQRALSAKRDVEAEAAIRKAVELNCKIVALEPQNPERLYEAIDSEMMHANFLLVLNRTDEPEKYIAAALETLNLIPPADAQSLQVRQLRARVWASLAKLHIHEDRYRDAEAEYAKVAKEFESLAKDFPDTPRYRYQVADAWWMSGWVAQYDQRLADARRYFEKAQGIATKLAEEHPEDAQFASLVARIEEDIRYLDAQPKKKP